MDQSERDSFYNQVKTEEIEDHISPDIEEPGPTYSRRDSLINDWVYTPKIPENN